MSLSAEMHVQTEHAGRYIAELCREFEERARRNPELGVRVECNETHGVVDFGWGRCTMSATSGAIILRAEAADHEGLRQVQELVRRHLEGHGEVEGLTVTWPQHPAADDHAERRDTMRAFHRRMRR